MGSAVGAEFLSAPEVEKRSTFALRWPWNVRSPWASTLKELPTNRRFMKGSQMIIESTTASGVVTKRIFEENMGEKKYKNLIYIKKYSYINGPEISISLKKKYY
eukprot:Skav229839  [mRNA]  locus=scaffold2033:53880:56961:+ [translate_table: standard]